MERTRRNDLKRDDESSSYRADRLEREMARARTRVRRRKLRTYVIVDRCRHRLVAGDRATGRASERDR